MSKRDELYAAAQATFIRRWFDGSTTTGRMPDHGQTREWFFNAGIDAALEYLLEALQRGDVVTDEERARHLAAWDAVSTGRVSPSD